MTGDLTSRAVDVDRYFVAQLDTDDRAAAAARDAGAAAGMPAIEVSAVHGRLLELLVAMSGAERILEVGTLAGVSTIYLLNGAGPRGTVVSLEVDEGHAAVATSNLERAGFDGRFEIIVGRADASLAAMMTAGVDPFDFVFIDADKESNPTYFDAAVALSRPGTVIYVDNVVRGGEVADSESDNPQVIGTRAMMERIAGHDGVEATAIQTLGSKGYDGFLLARVR